MELIIDGRRVEAQPGETLLALVRRLGLDTGAKIEASTSPSQGTDAADPQ